MSDYKNTKKEARDGCDWWIIWIDNDGQYSAEDNVVNIHQKIILYVHLNVKFFFHSSYPYYLLEKLSTLWILNKNKVKRKIHIY